MKILSFAAIINHRILIKMVTEIIVSRIPRLKIP